MLTPLQILKPDPDDPQTLRVKSEIHPFGIERNPVREGVQMGIAGATAGAGFAAIQRAIRLRSGNTDPVGVYGPMVLGATIGAALGTMGGYKAMKKLDEMQPQPQPGTWPELGAQLEQMGDPMVTSKYAGLKHITKQAGTAWDVASVPLSFVPGVGTAMSAVDATKNIGRGWSKLYHGDLRGAAGEGLGMLGNVGMGLAGLIPIFGNAARLAAKGVKGVKAVNYATRGAEALKNMQAGGQATGRFAGLWNRLSPLAKHVPGKAISGLERFGNRVEPLARGRNQLMLGGASMAATMGGSALNMAPELPMTAEQQAIRHMPVHTGSGRQPWLPGSSRVYMRGATPNDGTLFGPQAMPKFEVPDVQY